MKSAFGFILVIGLVASGAAYYTLHNAADATTSFRTATVSRGDLLSTIAATGTIEPEEVVDVGAQVAGKVDSLGRDPSDSKKSIDYGSVVKQGTVLAQIDDRLYKAQVDQADASRKRAIADLGQMKAKRDQTEQEWKRAKSLLPSKAIAPTDYDLAYANYKMAVANVDVGEATIKQDEAMLSLAKTNLDYTVIKSPVDGVIVDRRVNIGQTVVASLNAPSMFLIAKDLRKVQVWASVNEADIGKIHMGLPVRFTVDAYPNETFHGNVIQIRLNATMTQNVVTYTVVVETDNSDLKLLPYLTANLQFEIEQHTGVLLVSNAALRWKPRLQQVAPEDREGVAAILSGKAGSKGAGSSGGKDGDGGDKGGTSGSPARSAASPKSAKPAARDRAERGRLWVVEDNFVRPIEVQIGASDGTNTEVTGGGVSEGMEVVTGEILAADQDAETTNPFAPKLFRGKKKM